MSMVSKDRRAMSGTKMVLLDLEVEAVRTRVIGRLTEALCLA